MTGTDLKWTASRNDLEREINAEKARTDLRDSSSNHGDDFKTEERRLAERLSKLRLDMHVMAGDGSCQVCCRTPELCLSSPHSTARHPAISEPCSAVAPPLLSVSQLTSCSYQYRTRLCHGL